jgi:hypothetical protein
MMCTHSSSQCYRCSYEAQQAHASHSLMSWSCQSKSKGRPQQTRSNQRVADAFRMKTKPHILPPLFGWLPRGRRPENQAATQPNSVHDTSIQYISIQHNLSPSWTQRNLCNHHHQVTLRQPGHCAEASTVPTRCQNSTPRQNWESFAASQSMCRMWQLHNMYRTWGEQLKTAAQRPPHAS